ncbi:MAG: FeoB-associated Cys-rich membrane protein [Fusobacteriaceae bacterium]|jgi:hypothetical protein|nr:FeoB-associated Cys-rich membrane protein [Fusobacteriaceae bacterium]
MQFLKENIGTIAVAAALAIIVLWIVRKLVRDRRAGRTCGSCPDNCGCCGESGKK